jgi:hypothetical protein
VQQAAFRRLLLDAAVPPPLVPPPPLPQPAPPLARAPHALPLSLLGEDARAFAGAHTHSRRCPVHPFRCRLLSIPCALQQAECLPLALQAFLTPGVATVALALLFYVLDGAGLVGALITALALAAAAAAPAAAPAALLRPTRLALLAASGPLAAAAAFAIHGRQARDTSELG